MKQIRNVIGIVLISGIVSFAVVRFFGTEKEIIIENKPEVGKSYLTNLPGTLEGVNFDFSAAAELSVDAVVHVTTESIRKSPGHTHDPFYQFFYGRPMPPQSVKSSGSGVIISDNGYVVTNNHVVRNAENIEVALNDKQWFKATLVGSDPTTDLALLKLEGENLPYLSYGNSDETRVGEWVLAVGNPFNLTSTVTAGIVSAKGRNINILGADPRTGSQSIESFIQTDAAVNPGNSGGALVNVRGELIGINSAIKSATGSYVGYSFAIPVNIVKKVVNDLKEFGAVQRAFIGVNIKDIDKNLAEREGLEKVNGVYVVGTIDNGAAEDAGIEEGDVIVRVGSVTVNTVPELQEQINQFRPGDEVNITLERDGEEIVKKMVLKNLEGNTGVVKKVNRELMESLGARFEDVSNDEKEKLNISGGAKVAKLWSGKLMQAGVQEGFIVTRIDQEGVESPSDISRILDGKKGGVLFSGIYPNGKERFYGFGL